MYLLPVLAILALIYLAQQGDDAEEDAAVLQDGWTDETEDVFEDIMATVFPFRLPANVDALIERYAGLYGVPVELAKAQAWQESQGLQSALSRVGAIGVFQIMPPTAGDLGINPRDLEQNVEGGIRYMKMLLQRYNGNERLALAAYNWGMGNVDKWLRRTGGAGAFTDWQGNVVKETNTYVANILRYAGRA